MVDPFSIATGVAGLISLGIQVTESLVEFYNSYKSLDANVDHTTTKIETLLTTFRSLDAALQMRSFKPDEQDLIKNIESSVQSCEESIRELQDEYGKLNKTSVGDIRGTLKAAGRRAAYPFRQSTLQKLDEDIGEIRDSLSLALDILQLNDRKKAQDDIAELKLLLTLVNSAQISSTVREWLKASDASVNHNAACAKRHPGTGMWFINGPHFTTWLKQDASFLWLNGPAGCGKSVLCATAIQHTFRQRHSVLNAGIAFFYFTFSDDSKQDDSAMLRALFLQLSGQLPNGQAILDRMRTSYPSATPPTPYLIEHLRDLVQRFDQVYVLLDAIDECPRYDQRDQVLDALEVMRKWSLPGLHLLVASRDEPDIRDSLHPAPDQTLIMKNTEIDQDISDFISSQLNTKLPKWRVHHERIKEALTERAQGVFRWVECQFESLRRCPHSEYQLNRCLRSLPQSLDETYERMLCNIDEDSVEEARRILTLISFSSRPLQVPELIDAIAVNLKEPAGLDYRRRLQDADDICNICPGLIDIRLEKTGPSLEHNEVQETPTVRLAHFSVQEYLESDRIAKQKAAKYALQSAPAHAEIAQICLVYLLEPGLPKAVSEGAEVTAFPLSLFAAQFWYDHYRSAGVAASTFNGLILRLFGQQDTLTTWLRLIDTKPWARLKLDRDPWSIVLLVFCASALGLDEVLSELLTLEDSPSERRDLINRPTGDEHRFTLDVAAEYGQEIVVRKLLDAAASVGRDAALSLTSKKDHKNMLRILLDADQSREELDLPLCMAMMCDAKRRQEVTRILLDAGADANGSGGRSLTPLDLALILNNSGVAKILLDAEADLDAVSRASKPQYRGHHGAAVQRRWRSTKYWRYRRG